MKTPEFLAPYVDGDSPTRLFQGLAAGVIATLIIGFGFSGWTLGGTAKEQVETAKLEAMVSALAPICADKFEHAAKANNDLIKKIAAVDSWQRDGHLLKAGYATFPGGQEPSNNVAEACAALLNTALKLK